PATELRPRFRGLPRHVQRIAPWPRDICSSDRNRQRCRRELRSSLDESVHESADFKTATACVILSTHRAEAFARRHMKKQLVLTRSGLSGIVVGVLIVGLAVGFAAQNGQRGTATPAAPCGPNIAGDLGMNTSKNSRCFELRMYTVDTSKSRIHDLHKRFRE